MKNKPFSGIRATADVAEGETVTYYPATPPTPDTRKLSQQGRRVILQHSRNGLQIRVAPKGQVYAGWVIGLEIDNKPYKLQ